MCNEREEGVAGARSLRKADNYDAAIAKMTEFRDEDFRNNEDKLKELVLQGFAPLGVSTSDEIAMCAIAAERSKGNIQDQSTKGYASGTDARRTRSVEVLYGGPNIVERPGYQLVLNDAGSMLVSGIQKDMEESQLQTRCLKSLIARPDTLQTTENCLGVHADIGKDDVHPETGFPFLHVMRCNLMCGMAVELNFHMKLVDYIYQEDGKNGGEWVQRISSPIASCKFLFPSGFAAYVMDSKTAGRHPIGAMRCEKDGNMKLVVLYHSSRYSSRGDDGLGTRTIMLRDCVFSSAEDAALYLKQLKEGNAKPFHFKSLAEPSKKLCREIHDSSNARATFVNQCVVSTIAYGRSSKMCSNGCERFAEFTDTTSPEVPIPICRTCRQKIDDKFVEKRPCLTCWIKTRRKGQPFCDSCGTPECRGVDTDGMVRWFCQNRKEDEGGAKLNEENSNLDSSKRRCNHCYNKFHSSEPWTAAEDTKLKALVKEHRNDWSKISKEMPFRDKDQCRHRWNNHLDPNKKEKSTDSWTAAEDTKLKALVEEHRNDWSKISKEMPSRDRGQCVQRWDYHLDPNKKEKSTEPWTAVEDEMLKALVEVRGNEWSKISKEMPSRDRRQCRHRWIDHLDPNKKKEKSTDSWTAAEDTKLQALVEVHGNRWTKISEDMPSRDKTQCMHRWIDHLDPNKKEKSTDSWTAAEDTKLQALVEVHGNRWTKISKEISSRDKTQCRHRWNNHLDPNKKEKSSEPWTAAEDTKLQALVGEHGNDWSKISKEMPSRDKTQCRHRWIDHLDPNKKEKSTEPWTAAEDTKLQDLVEKHRNKWLKISEDMPSRDKDQCMRRWKRHLDPNKKERSKKPQKRKECVNSCLPYLSKKPQKRKECVNSCLPYLGWEEDSQRKRGKRG